MNNDRHTPPQPIENHGQETHAYWSYIPSGKLMVLVHGFTGNARDTWRGLPQQLTIQKAAADYDIVSFDYTSVKQTADQSANQLHNFLDQLMMDPLKIVNRSIENYDSKLRRAAEFSYRQVILVGHSLGACVARRMLLDQLTAGKNKWNADYKLVCYAPAHGGARIELLMSAVATAIPWNIGQAAKKGAQGKYPVIIDLEQGSDFLKKLQAETDKERGNYPELLSPLTFWVKDDAIVFNRRFSKDTVPCHEIENVDHSTIVKIDRYDQRLSHLLAQM